MKDIHILSIFALWMLAIVGCDSSNKSTEEEEPYLKLSGYSITISNGSPAQLQIDYWTNLESVEIDLDETTAQWCEVSLTTQYIEFKVEQNPSIELERVAIIYLTATDPEIDPIIREITITQEPLLEAL